MFKKIFKKIRPNHIVTALVLVFFAVWASVIRAPSASDVKVVFFDVGQGDAALIQRGDFQVLIDGGPDEAVLSKLGQYMPLWDKDIEVMVLSHPHADHIFGLNLVLDRYNVKKVYYSGAIHTSDIFLMFLEKVQDEGAELIVPGIGEAHKAFPGGSLSFLWPGDRYLSKKPNDLNSSSEVLKFCYVEECVLFTGDIEADEQGEVLRHVDMKNFVADVYKFPHHGALNGLNSAFVSAVNPKTAVISVGKNSYGHPHEKVLDYLSGQEIEVLRTDKQGDIVYHLSDK